MPDEFDVALQMPSTDAGAESAAITRRGDAAPAGDNPNIPPPDSTTAVRDQRVVSEATRKAIRAIAEAGRKADTAIAVDDELVPMEHEGGAKPAPAAAPSAKSPPASAAPAPPAQPAEPTPAAQQPTATSAAAAQATAAEIMARAEMERVRGEHDRRAKELDAREAALAAREKLLPERTAIAERPLDAFEAFVRNALGLGDKDDAELKDAIGDIITEASIKHFGVDPGADVKSKIESRKALRAVKAYKSDFQRQQEALAAQRAAQAQADKEAEEQRQAADNERKAIALVYDLVGGTKDSHPFLHAAGDLGLVEDPTAVVVELIRDQRRRGEPADWQAAVKLANDHFRPKVEAAVKKSTALTTLLNPAPAKQPAAAAPAAPASQQVGEQVRRPTTLTTTPTAPASHDPTAEDGPETEDRYDRRHRQLRSTFAKHRSRFTPAES